MATPPPPPPPVQRPKFAQWCFDRRLTRRAVARALGCSSETVRRIHLPFGDGGRRVPYPDLMDRIVVWTCGEVQPASFYPTPEILARLRERAAA